MSLLVAELQAKMIAISEIEKFRQHLFFPLYHHFQLQLELNLGEAESAIWAIFRRWSRWSPSYTRLSVVEEA